MNTQNLSEIHVNNMRVYANHGCLDQEALIGTQYVVDVELLLDFSEAALKDDLNLTVDYCDVYEVVKKQMAIRSKLIEQVAHRILTELKKGWPQVVEARVKVTKINPPLNGDVGSVAVMVKG